MTPLTEEAQQKAGVTGAVTNGQITCVAREMVMQRQVKESAATQEAPPPPDPAVSL